MTTTENQPQADPEAAATASDWAQQLAALQVRYPKIREPILAALHILMQNPNVSVDDAKAQAAAHGVRITAASVAAAQRLLSRRDGADGDDEPKAKLAVEPPRSGRARRPRPPTKEVDPEALIRGLVGKIQAQGNAEADRLRDAVRRAITMLQTAVDS